jgi:hypothetical protein
MEYNPSWNVPATLSEADFICPRELAAQLIDRLLNDTVEDDWERQTIPPRRPPDAFRFARTVTAKSRF